MPRSTKVLLTVVLLLGACLFALDAQAGNLRSNSTPTVKYWYRVVKADHYLQYIGGQGHQVIIDDITYYGHPRPGTDGIDEEACVFDPACSFFSIGFEEEDFGTLVNLNESDTWINGTSSPFSNTITVTSTSNIGSTSVWQSARQWEHALTLADTPPVVVGNVIDKWTLTGHAYVAVRETERIASYIRESTTTYGDGESIDTGGAGIGMGVGTGLGTTAWLVDTSVHRPYQNPYPLIDHQLQLLATNFPSGEVLLRGRIIEESTEYMQRTNSFLMQPNP